MEVPIFRLNHIRQWEIAPQKNIDYWCGLCKFPLTKDGTRCKDPVLIQQCWDEDTSTAHVWHLKHECPFVKQGQECRCDSYPNIKAAFEAAGLSY